MGKSTVRVGSIVIDVDNFAQMMTFWQEALGYAPGRPPTPDDPFVILKDPTGKGPNVSIDQMEPYRGRLPSTYTPTTRKERSTVCLTSARPYSGLASPVRILSSSPTQRAISSGLSTRDGSPRTGGG